MVGDLEEERPARLRHAGERADDHVVDEAADVLRALRTRDVRVEDLEEVAEALALGLEAEVLVGLERGDVERDVVVERDRVEPEVGAAPELAAVRVGEAALDLVERRRAEGPRGRLRVGLAGEQVDVGRVVGADGRRDRRVVEQPLLDRQDVVGARGHEHDVDQPLADDLAHLVAVLGQRSRLAGDRIGAGRRKAGGHVGVLGVGEDEVGRAAGSAWMLASLASSDFMPVPCRVD